MQQSHAKADKGGGALVPRRVTRLYRITTTEWLRLRWIDGTAREVITTPGHHFLEQSGGFPTIEEVTRTGRATVLLASSALTEVTGEGTPSVPAWHLCSSRRWGDGLKST